jgi:hypothetical protein
MDDTCFDVPGDRCCTVRRTRCVVRLTLRAEQMQLRTAALSSKQGTRVGKKKLSTSFQAHCVASSLRGATSRTCAAASKSGDRPRAMLRIIGPARRPGPRGFVCSLAISPKAWASHRPFALGQGRSLSVSPARSWISIVLTLAARRWLI